MAKKYNLPRKVLSTLSVPITEKAKVKNTSTILFKNKYPDREIDESLFTYDGPDPVSREYCRSYDGRCRRSSLRTLVDKTEKYHESSQQYHHDGQLGHGRYANADITFKGHLQR